MSVNQNAQAMNEISLNQEGRHHRTNGKSSWEHKGMDVCVERGQGGLKEASLLDSHELSTTVRPRKAFSKSMEIA